MEIIKYTGTNQSKKWGMAAREKWRKLIQWEHPKSPLLSFNTRHLPHQQCPASLHPSLRPCCTPVYARLCTQAPQPLGEGNPFGSSMGSPH